MCRWMQNSSVGNKTKIATCGYYQTLSTTEEYVSLLEICICSLRTDILVNILLGEYILCHNVGVMFNCLSQLFFNVLYLIPGDTQLPGNMFNEYTHPGVIATYSQTKFWTGLCTNKIGLDWLQINSCFHKILKTFQESEHLYDWLTLQ